MNPNLYFDLLLPDVKWYSMCENYEKIKKYLRLWKKWTCTGYKTGIEKTKIPEDKSVFSEHNYNLRYESWFKYTFLPYMCTNIIDTLKPHISGKR